MRTRDTPITTYFFTLTVKTEIALRLIINLCYWYTHWVKSMRIFPLLLAAGAIVVALLTVFLPEAEKCPYLSDKQVCDFFIVSIFLFETT